MGKALTIVAFVLSFFIPIVGLILGIIAYNEAKKDPEALKGLAIAAIIIGGIFTLVAIIGMILVLVVWTQVGGQVDYASEQISVTTECLNTNILVEADSFTDTVTVSKVKGEITGVKIIVNNGDKTAEINGSEFIGGPAEIKIDLEPNDLVMAAPEIGDHICPQFVSATAK